MDTDIDTIAAQLASKIKGAGRRVLFVAGLGGAGKTTFCNALLESPRFPPATMLHVDWFLRDSSSERRRKHGNQHPRYWTNEAAFLKALSALKSSGRVHLENVWNQQTGKKDLSVDVIAPENSVIVCDGIYLLHSPVVLAADLRVLLTTRREEAARRAELRDAHRSDDAYFEWKRMLRAKYDEPYFVDHAVNADLVIDSVTREFQRPPISPPYSLDP